MKQAWWVVPALGVILAATIPGAAQEEPRGFEKASNHGAADLRAGAGWGRASSLVERGGGQFDIGFGLLAYFGQEGVRHRFGFNFALDFLPVDTTDFFDETLGTRARLSKQLLILNPGLGFDVVQTPHVDVTLHYGGALVANLTRFELRNTFGQFEDVCNLEAFRNLCPTRWGFLGNARVGARFFPRRNHPFYFGVDYARYALGRNHLVGTIGLAF